MFRQERNDFGHLFKETTIFQVEKFKKESIHFGDCVSGREETMNSHPDGVPWHYLVFEWQTISQISMWPCIEYILYSSTDWDAHKALNSTSIEFYQFGFLNPKMSRFLFRFRLDFLIYIYI